MKITESVLREKISRILNEQLKYTSLRGKDLTAGADKTMVDGAKVFTVNDAAVSHFLHDITEPGSILSYISWRIVFEELLYKNLEKGSNLNAEKRNNVFSDVSIDGVNYSVKSTTIASTTQSGAVSQSPSLTISTIKSRVPTQKYGIIVGKKVENNLMWWRYGQIKTGKQLKKSLDFLEYLESVDNSSAVAALKQLRLGKNPRYIIKFFFDPTKEFVNAQRKYEDKQLYLFDDDNFKDEMKKITVNNPNAQVAVQEVMTVKLGEKTIPDDLQYNGKAVQVNFIISRLAKFNQVEIEEVIRLVAKTSDIDTV